MRSLISNVIGHASVIALLAVPCSSAWASEGGRPQLIICDFIVENDGSESRADELSEIWILNKDGGLHTRDFDGLLGGHSFVEWQVIEGEIVFVTDGYPEDGYMLTTNGRNVSAEHPEPNSGIGNQNGQLHVGMCNMVMGAAVVAFFEQGKEPLEDTQ